MDVNRLIRGLSIVCAEPRNSRLDFDVTMYRDILNYAPMEIHTVMNELGTLPNEEQSFQNLYWKLRERYPEQNTSVVHYLTPFIRCPDTIDFLYEITE